MNKTELKIIKKSLVALGVAGTLIGSTGCGKNVEAKDSEAILDIVPEKYYNFDEYCKYIIRNDEPVKVYNSENVSLFYDKKTYDVSEYIDNYTSSFFPVYELYDLITEKMLMYCRDTMYGPITDYNYTDWYLEELESNNYRVNLLDASKYIEGYKVKDYYSLEEIREIEPQIGKYLKAINKAKVKTK